MQTHTLQALGALAQWDRWPVSLIMLVGLLASAALFRAGIAAASLVPACYSALVTATPLR